MPSWLTDPIDTTAWMGTPGDSDALQMALRLGAAFLCGCVIAGIYWAVRPREQFMPTFPATLVLLAILCAMLPLVIGQNVAWAFGLVGALSIVRFRTVVEDTQDITFVIFAVLTGMAVGADQMTVAVVGMAVTGMAAFLFRPKGSNGPSFDRGAKLQIRLGAGRDPDVVFKDVFAQALRHVQLSAGATSKQGASIDLTYQVCLQPDFAPTDLINQLNLIEGVQSVELRQS
ncbi:hypothetical protein Mal15_04230 [Stieleria maiorica]|uniref:DUF4956 domain-containing protein n=1 Tax=Stieleria maiorica TaxID=2795974 RepID=A0A5B9MA38_9BACT|nr:DUF4956 domain-containing protein [Stieleria maiorica]QEF96395.1 hypothetical protein Mal15_04230 [Stieleria maiorica]